jgi:hypothetical protein
MKIFLLLLALLFAAVVSDEKCCVECTVEGEIKYYSIDSLWNRCGECCMNPDKYWIYHIFESGLTEADVDHPCEELGYTEYEKTETHGAMGITMTLDKYKKP